MNKNKINSNENIMPLTPALLPEYRGNGLGRAMLRAALTEISRLGRRASLCVNTNNAEGLKLYLSEDFKKKETNLAMVYEGE